MRLWGDDVSERQTAMLLTLCSLRVCAVLPFMLQLASLRASDVRCRTLPCLVR